MAETKWTVYKEIWRYLNAEKKYMVEVHKWEEHGKIHWNKYLYLYPGNPDFGKYKPDEGRAFPETPYEWNYGVTYYHEAFDKSGNMTRQEFGDDYKHAWDDPVDGEGTRVFEDAVKLIEKLEAI